MCRICAPFTGILLCHTHEVCRHECRNQVGKAHQPVCLSAHIHAASAWICNLVLKKLQKADKAVGEAL